MTVIVSFVILSLYHNYKYAMCSYWFFTQICIGHLGTGVAKLPSDNLLICSYMTLINDPGVGRGVMQI